MLTFLGLLSSKFENYINCICLICTGSVYKGSSGEEKRLHQFQCVYSNVANKIGNNVRRIVVCVPSRVDREGESHWRGGFDLRVAEGRRLAEHVFRLVVLLFVIDLGRLRHSYQARLAQLLVRRNVCCCKRIRTDYFKIAFTQTRGYFMKFIK